MRRKYEDKMIHSYEDKAKKNVWICIASGPSLTKEDVELVRGRNVIVINDNYKLAPWGILYFCDPHWFAWHKEGVKNFKGPKYSQYESWEPAAIKEAEACGVKFTKSKQGSGISTDDAIYTGCNSGIQAINLAYSFGAKEIILLGYDQQATNGKSHWFGDHPTGLTSVWSQWKDHYKKVAEDAEKLGVNIINCTRQTSLTCFKRMSLELALSLEQDQALLKTS